MCKVDVHTADRSNSIQKRYLSTMDVVEAVVAALELINSKKPWLKMDDTPELKIKKGQNASVIDAFKELAESRMFFSKEN